MNETEMYDLFLKQMDFTKIEKYSFLEFVEALLKEGSIGEKLQTIGEYVFDTFLYELSVEKSFFIYMIGFVLIFALFQNVLVGKNKYLSRVSFYLAYITVMTVVMQSFMVLTNVAREAIEEILTFMELLITIYETILIFTGNVATATNFCNFVFLLIYLIECGMKYILLPGIHIYVLLQFLNHLWEKEKISQFVELIEKAIQFVLKTVLGLVLGIQVIENLIATAKDRVSNSAVLEGLSSLPGMGNVFGSSIDVFLGCGILVKNCMGGAAFLVLIVLVSTPAVKIFLSTLLYRLLGAILQPVGEEGFSKCIHGVAKGCELLLKVIGYTVFLFLIVITLICMTTGYGN